MKILHVMAGADRGGAETFFQDSLVALHESGVEQAVVTRDNHPHKIKLIEERNIPLRKASFNKYWRWPTSKAIADNIKTFQPDIAQYWMGRAGSFGQKHAGKNIAWYGGYYKPTRFKYADAHVGVTKDIADHIVRQGVPAERVFVLHTYAEFEEEPPVSRADFDTPDDAPLLLALSRLHWKKGLDVLLQSMQQIPDAYLWIAGSGPLEKELKALCTDLGLDARVRFLGWREDRGALLEASDICVFPSRYEPFGTVTVEAWGRGVPLVAAKAAGPKAFVNHGEDGLLVEIDDIDGLAAAVNAIIADPALAEKLKQGGLNSYNTGFTRKVFQKNAKEFYDAVLRLRP
jgi:glycosyltransferase involved in cell wall biosynthesis